MSRDLRLYQRAALRDLQKANGRHPETLAHYAAIDAQITYEYWR